MSVRQNNHERSCAAGHEAIVLFGSPLPGKPTYLVEWHTLVPTLHKTCFIFYPQADFWEEAMCTTVDSAHADFCFIAGHEAFVLFGSLLPGKPAYALEWHTLVATWHRSCCICYIQTDSLDSLFAGTQGCSWVLMRCRVRGVCAVWQLHTRQARLCSGVAHFGGDLELQHQLLLREPDPELARHTHH